MSFQVQSHCIFFQQFYENNPSKVSIVFQSDKSARPLFVGGDIVLHRLEQLAPFPAMSIAVVCSVDAQGRLNHQVSSKKQKRKPQIAIKTTPVWFKHVLTVNSNLYKSFNATLQKVPFNMSAEKW